ncbi:MAG: CoA-binding protein [Acidobacteriota bacterium]
MDERVVALLRGAREIAVVGISDKPDRPSHYVAAYLQQCGYSVLPVNPVLPEVLGVKCHRDLAAIGRPVDIVDVFRKPEAVPDIVEEAIAAKARALWLQEGIRHDEAARRAEEAGLMVIQDLCIKKVLEALGGRP